MAALRVVARSEGREQEIIHPDGPLEIGRGRPRELPRLMLTDPTVSRDHVRITVQPDGQLLVENLSSSSEVFLDRGPVIGLGEQRLVPLPVTLGLGNTDVAISLAATAGEPVIGDRPGVAAQPMEAATGVLSAPVADAPELQPPAVQPAPAPLAVAAGAVHQDDRRTPFEHHFPASVAAALALDPAVLQGREREVTLLFLEVPAFVSLAASVGPARAFAMLTELADLATGFIEETEGVFVDGSGASLLAMWNAPLDVNEHAWKASIAAQRLTAAVQAFSDRWLPESGVPLRSEAAVATLTAAVGLTSGTRRLSYGPIEGAARMRSYAAAARGLGVSILVTAATRARLPADLALRRLGPVDLPLGAGVEELFQLLPGPAPAEWLQRRESFERALSLFEGGAFVDAAAALSELVRSGWHDDVATLRLLARALEQQAQPVNLATVYPPRSRSR